MSKLETSYFAINNIMNISLAGKTIPIKEQKETSKFDYMLHKEINKLKEEENANTILEKGNQSRQDGIHR